MDQNQPVNTDFEKQKKEISSFIANELLRAVKDKKIDITKLRPVAQEILLEVDKINQEKDLIPVLEFISKKWSYLSGLLLKFKYENQSSSEKKVIEKLSKYINTIN